MIKYLSSNLKLQFEDSHLDRLVKMMTFTLSGYIEYMYDVPLYITSIYRPEDTHSVHGYWRGLDLDNDADLVSAEKQAAADWLNSLFIYDITRPEKKVCVYHAVKGRGGDHFHIQSHLNTTIRG